MAEVLNFTNEVAQATCRGCLLRGITEDDWTEVITTDDQIALGIYMRDIRTDVQNNGVDGETPRERVEFVDDGCMFETSDMILKDNHVIDAISACLVRNASKECEDIPRDLIRLDVDEIELLGSIARFSSDKEIARHANEIRPLLEDILLNNPQLVTSEVAFRLNFMPDRELLLELQTILQKLRKDETSTLDY